MRLRCYSAHDGIPLPGQAETHNTCSLRTSRMTVSKEGDIRQCVTPSSHVHRSGTTDMNLRHLGEMTSLLILALIPGSLQGWNSRRQPSPCLRCGARMRGLPWLPWHRFLGGQDKGCACALGVRPRFPKERDWHWNTDSIFPRPWPTSGCAAPCQSRREPQQGKQRPITRQEPSTRHYHHVSFSDQQKEAC